MKIIHDGTKVLNNTVCGHDPRKYPRLNKHGKPLPGHGYYILEGDELAKFQAKQEKESNTTDALIPETERQWEEIGKKRDELLTAIEWVNDENANLSKKKKAAFDKYRKQLENLKSDFESPADVIWPDKPEK
ncbi:MAG: phage tail assembly chaperone [Proteobacteria bacterium]|nr:phage tail assembly chaperone [Pseudomonadota bacterium]